MKRAKKTMMTALPYLFSRIKRYFQNNGRYWPNVSDGGNRENDDDEFYTVSFSKL